MMDWRLKAVLQGVFSRVPWGEVSVIAERIKLKSRATELGLGIADRKASRLVRGLPGA